MTKPQYLVEIAGEGLLYDENRRKCGVAAGPHGGVPAGYERRLVVGSTLCGGEWDDGLAQFSQSQRSGATLWRLGSSAGAAGAPEEQAGSDDAEPLEPKSLT